MADGKVGGESDVLVSTGALDHADIQRGGQAGRGDQLDTLALNGIGVAGQVAFRIAGDGDSGRIRARGNRGVGDREGGGATGRDRRSGLHRDGELGGTGAEVADLKATGASVADGVGARAVAAVDELGVKEGVAGSAWGGAAIRDGDTIALQCQYDPVVGLPGVGGQQAHECNRGKSEEMPRGG